MKAIYEVKFLEKKNPAVTTDSRRIAKDASSKGLQAGVRVGRLGVR